MMRFSIFTAVLVAQSAFVSLRAQASTGGKIDLPAYPASPAAERSDAGSPTAFSIAETWLAENAPQCPPAIASEIAAKFVEQFSLRYPGEADRLARSEVALGKFESLLWQVTAARLSGPAYEAARQTFAVRRVSSVLSAQGAAADAKRVEAAVARLKSDAPAAYRRLAEGKMEDEDLLRLPGLKAARETARQQKTATAMAQPKVMTALEIAGEFSRRNQQGAAATKLQAYCLEARLHSTNGAAITLEIFKLRPDLFRIHVRQPEQQTQVLAYDGAHYWRQQGAKVEAIDPAALGSLRFLSEFLDPLLEPDPRQIERLEDTTFDGRKCYRLRVQREGASSYIAFLDQENFHTLAREDASGTMTRYADFRDVAGITLAYREELLGANGTSTTLEVVRFTPNPGLISGLFREPTAEQLDLGPLEQVLAKGTP